MSYHMDQAAQSNMMQTNSIGDLTTNTWLLN